MGLQAKFLEKQVEITSAALLLEVRNLSFVPLNYVPLKTLAELCVELLTSDPFK